MKSVFNYGIVLVLGLSLAACSKAKFTSDNISESAKIASTIVPTGEGCYTETFQVPPAVPKPVDVLFVMQTSASIDDIRQKIISGIDGFVNNLPAGSDFNIAVMLSHGSTSDYSGRLYRVSDEPLVLKTSSMTNTQIQNYLDTKLTQTVMDVQSGGGEEGMYSLFHAITTPALLAEAQSVDFFRANAALSVVFIGDRRDICAAVPAGVPPETDPFKIDARIRDCEGLTAAGLNNRLVLLKGSQTLQVNGIIYADAPAPVGKEIGYGYIDVINLNGGSAIDIANDNITMGLNPVIALGSQAAVQTEFPLSRSDVDPSTIKVMVNGQPATFTYDGSKVTVTSPVPAGATVSIYYCLKKGENPYTGICSVFENINDAATPEMSTEDLEIKNKAGFQTVGAVRNLLIQNVAGGFSVQSAMSISSLSSAAGASYVKVSGDIGNISNMAGPIRIDKAGNVTSASGLAGLFQLNALSLGSFTNTAGDACLKVKKITKIHSTAGRKVIIADQVDELSAQAGEVHIYGAVVKSVTNMAGRICLHNGAQVQFYSNVAGFIGECP